MHTNEPHGKPIKSCGAYIFVGKKRCVTETHLLCLLEGSGSRKKIAGIVGKLKKFFGRIFVG
jgi:hypothetical protein